MIESMDNRDDLEKNEREEIFSRVVKAGKRTYFFDVKATRNNEYFLTVTESKKRLGKDGKFYFEKHKIFLYKEDFEKFMEGLNDVVDYISKNQEVIPRAEYQPEENELVDTNNEYASLDFEDLDK
ncbi:MAG: PUR family DNA/RNA-binding protein [Bacteroidales bacterium]|nr:PUR family DNA/RNA-binding protein [Bacteroidales bacterium]HPD95342.1 DUF3276 family protein [Tenuifilaceae bacterium]HRX30973.1 DUF3276 family protein [Tenuifilaceae bacterium]